MTEDWMHRCARLLMVAFIAAVMVAFTVALVLRLDAAPVDRVGAQTHPPAGAEAYGTVFDQWVKNRQPKTAILVVRRGGKTMSGVARRW